MHASIRHLRGAAGSAVIAVSVMTGLAVTGQAAAAEWRPGDRATLAELRVAGKSHATVLLLAVPGGFAQARQAAIGAGGEIQKELADIGYLRIKVALSNVDRFLELPGVQRTAISQSQLFVVQSAGAAAAPASSIERRPAPPTRFLPDDNPYTSLNALGVLDFNRAHPNYDGRGVTIGIIEEGVDLGSPDLGAALDLNGMPRPKVVDWMSPAAPAEDISALSSSFYGSYLEPADGAHVLVEPVVAQGDQVTFRGRTYLLPADAGRGRLGMGIVDGSRIAPSAGGMDLNVDGKVSSESDSYAVLLDGGTAKVWVDAHQNADFSSVPAVRDFSLTREWGQLGTDDPTTPARESTPYSVHVDAAGGEVRFDFGTRMVGHGMMVAGFAAGGRFLDGPRIGVAPHAAIMIGTLQARYVHNYLEMAAELFTDPRADLVSWSGGDSLRPSDGSAFLDLAVQRILRLNDKPVLIGAGNLGPFIGQTLSPSVVEEAISVGAYTPRDAVEAFRGFTPTNEHTVATYTAAGPTDDGRVKPEVLGLTETLSLATYGHPGRGGLPPGYAISSGTSAATPTVAGVTALLISAAKQAGVPYGRARIKAALIASARYLEGVEAWRQGNGVVQAPEAWELLKCIPRDWTPTLIESFAPVRTGFSHRLATPGVGRGIFERGGWAKGQTATRTIRFVRRGGPEKPLTYTLRWKGETGAFRAGQQQITLPLNSPVELKVRITPTRSGVNAVILDLLEPDTDLIAYQVMNTVIVPEKLDRAHGYAARVNGAIPRPGAESVFLDVPQGTRALRVRCELKDAYAVVRLAGPDGQPFSSFGSAVGFLPRSSIKNGVFEISIPEPDAGVWQVALQNSGDSFDKYDPDTRMGVKPASFTFEAFALRAEETIEAPRRGGEHEFDVAFVNRYAPESSARIEGMALGLEYEEQIRLTPETRSREFSVDVAPGTLQLEWKIEGQDPARGEVNLYAFDASGKSPVLRGFATRPGAQRRLVIRNPAPGRWTVSMDAQRIASAGVNVKFEQVVLHPSFGRLRVVKAAAGTHGPTATFSAVPRATAPPGYSLVARVALVSDAVTGLITRRDERGSDTDVNNKPYLPEKYRVPLGEATVSLP